MKKTFKTICLAVAFLASSSSFADSSMVAQSSQSQNNANKKQTNAPVFEQGLGLPANKYPAAYNAPARICLKNSWDFDVFGSFIYWHASESQLTPAYVPVNATASPTTTISGTTATQNVKYEPGFKVGFGFNLGYDGWAFRGEYTWLHQTISNSSVAPALPTGAAGVWSANEWFTGATAATPLNTGASEASSWALKIDMVDAVFERPFYQGTQLTVTPFGGMRALWLRQKFNIDLLNTAGVTTSSSNNRSNSWALGPTTGVGGHWLLGWGFRFEGNSQASVLYTRYTKITHSEQDSQVLTPGVLAVTSSTSNYNTLRTIGQLNLGLGWGTYCCDDEFYFDIGLDYEFMYFWNQNVMNRWVNQLQGFSSDAGDLYIHGLTATFRFDF